MLRNQLARLAAGLALVCAMTPAQAETDAPTPPAEAFDGDGSEGEKLFNRGGLGCRSCHAIDGPSRPTGPSLAGVIGRTAGTLEDFKYSQALLTSEVVWTPETLDAFLEKPRGFIPKNRMAYAGLRNPQDRANIIAYLLEAAE